MLRRQQAIVGIAERGARRAMLQRREDFVAQDLIKALGRRGEGLEVGVVQGTHRRMVEHLPVGLAEHQIDGVGRGAIGQRLAGKQHTVAGKAGFEAALRAIAAAVAELGDNIRAGILMEGGFEMRLLAAAGIQAQEGPHVAQTPQFEHAGQGRGRVSRRWLMTSVSSL